MRHNCPWPDCEYETDPRLGLCYFHWTQIPSALRLELQSTYREGWASQPQTHRNALIAARTWISENIGGEAPVVPPPVPRFSRTPVAVAVKRISRTR